jgi:hypothetical protein
VSATGNHYYVDSLPAAAVAGLALGTAASREVRPAPPRNTCPPHSPLVRGLRT